MHPTSLQRSDFDYDLPETLIAQSPLSQRTASRLLHLDKKGQCHHRHFNALEQLLKPGDLLVLNNTHVIKARLFGHKATGGKLEVMLERITDTHTAWAQCKASKSPPVGSTLTLDNETLTVTARDGDLFQLHIDSDCDWMTLTERAGKLPLPPYIQRDPNDEDDTRYQTVFSKIPGAVAAPTAGLHFNQVLLDALKAQGIRIAYVTLHVGAGTFQPVRTENIAEHRMHAEWLKVGTEACEAVRNTQKNGGRIVAVGTTAVRALETASQDGQIKPYAGESRLFLYPGKSFYCVDAMITNFHLPQSTLLMLVSAFAGRDAIKQAYAHAIKEKYRFFSYGDAMFLEQPACL
jgi:S-adenosylmethionine:tRNA ribosyltransferase-isomerase